MGRSRAVAGGGGCTLPELLAEAERRGCDLGEAADRLRAEGRLPPARAASAAPSAWSMPPLRFVLTPAAEDRLLEMGHDLGAVTAAAEAEVAEILRDRLRDGRRPEVARFSSLFALPDSSYERGYVVTPAGSEGGVAVIEVDAARLVRVGRAAGRPVVRPAPAAPRARRVAQ